MFIHANEDIFVSSVNHLDLVNYVGLIIDHLEQLNSPSIGNGITEFKTQVLRLKMYGWRLVVILAVFRTTPQWGKFIYRPTYI